MRPSKLDTTDHARPSDAVSKRFGSRAVIACAILLMAVLFGAVGCASGSQSQQHASVPTKYDSNSPLKVAVQYNALSIPTVFADESGYFEEEGLEVELSTFTNGAEENKVIEQGDIDIASDGLASVYLLSTGDFTWIGESDEGSATVGIYVREGSAPALVSGTLEDNPDVFGSADTLRGLTVVGPAGTMEEWVAVSFFSQFGLDANTDFEYIEMERNQAVENMKEGVADVFVATDVDYCTLMEENGFVALAKGADATLIPFNNGYLVNDRVLESRYDDLVGFLRAVYKAAEVLNSDPDLWNEFAFDYYKLNGKPATMEDVVRESQIRGLLLPTDFELPEYRLGNGVLSVGEFNASIGALREDQVQMIADSIDPKILEDALGISVQAATL